MCSQILRISRILRVVLDSERLVGIETFLRDTMREEISSEGFHTRHQTVHNIVQSELMKNSSGLPHTGRLRVRKTTFVEMLEFCYDLITGIRGQAGEIVNVLSQLVRPWLLQLQGFSVQVLVERFVRLQDSSSVTFKQRKSGSSPFDLGLDLAEKVG